MTTFCLVHGAWHDAACWQPLADELARRGHQCMTPVLPLEHADATFEDYAQVVVDRLEGRHRPVLVGHSMSSAVIPLVATKRPVRLLAYLCPAMGGFPAPADGPPYQRQSYERPPTDAKNRSWWPHERAVSQLYARAHPELAKRLARRLRPQPQTVLSDPYPPQRPPDVPSTFLDARG